MFEKRDNARHKDILSAQTNFYVENLKALLHCKKAISIFRKATCRYSMKLYFITHLYVLKFIQQINLNFCANRAAMPSLHTKPLEINCGEGKIFCFLPLQAKQSAILSIRADTNRREINLFKIIICPQPRKLSSSTK